MIEQISGANWRAAVAFSPVTLELMARAYLRLGGAVQVVFDADSVVGVIEEPTDVIDSREPWVKKQIDEYVATDGAKPKFRGGAPLVLLTYKGAKTGQWRRTCLIGAEFEGEYLLVASKGGAADHPKWYPNLLANPEAWLQVGAEYFPVRASTATPEDKPARWDFMVGLYPDYENYQKKTSRDIPVVRLTRL